MQYFVSQFQHVATRSSQPFSPGAWIWAASQFVLGQWMRSGPMATCTRRVSHLSVVSVFYLTLVCAVRTDMRGLLLGEVIFEGVLPDHLEAHDTWAMRTFDHRLLRTDRLVNEECDATRADARWMGSVSGRAIRTEVFIGEVLLSKRIVATRANENPLRLGRSSGSSPPSSGSFPRSSDLFILILAVVLGLLRSGRRGASGNHGGGFTVWRNGGTQNLESSNDEYGRVEVGIEHNRRGAW